MADTHCYKRCYICGGVTLESRIFYDGQGNKAYVHVGGLTGSECLVELKKKRGWYGRRPEVRAENKKYVGTVYPA